MASMPDGPPRNPAPTPTPTPPKPEDGNRAPTPPEEPAGDE